MNTEGDNNLLTYRNLCQILKKIGLGVGLTVIVLFIASFVFNLSQEPDMTKYDGLSPYYLSKDLEAEIECRGEPDCETKIKQMIEDFKNKGGNKLNFIIQDAMTELEGI